MIDWAGRRERYDGSGMFEKIRDLPEQMSDAVRRFPEEVPPVRREMRNVIFLGMGGSAIGGDIAAAIAAPFSSVPVSVVRGYEVPAWCGSSTLAIATSYSGNTEETLAASEEAVRRGADVRVITSGGAMGEWADRLGLPRVIVPNGRPPRTAVGYLTVSALLLIGRAGILPTREDAIEDARREVERLRREWGLEGEEPGECPPSMVAGRIGDRLPVIYHGGGVMTPVATRWRCQIEENGKRLAHTAAFPELNHNEIMGWEKQPRASERFTVVVLDDPAVPGNVRKGMDAALHLIEERQIPVVPVGVTGADPMARLYSALYFGDFVSYYIALLGEVDPTPIRSIDRLKKSLASDTRPSGEGGPGERERK